MKTFTLLSALFATAYAAEAAEAAEAAAWATYNSLVAGGQGEQILPKFASHPALDGAKRIHNSLGPWPIQSSAMTKKTLPVRIPCPHTGGCLVTAMEATIKYANGAEANTDTGAWMHHIAMFGSLGKDKSAKGGLGSGLLAGGGSGGIWAAGNERPTLRLNSEDYKYGLDFSNYMIIVDLMSEDTKRKNVTLEITYEVVPKNKAGYKIASMYWLTIGEPAAKQGKYSFNTMPMAVKSPGKLLYAIGHMHDGGTDMVLKVSGKQVCKSVMFYGKPGEGAPKNAAGGHSHKMRKVKRQHAHGAGAEGAVHIRAPGACTFFGKVQATDRLSAVANYDASKFALMMHNGKAEKLMGNMRVYIGPN